MQRSFARGGALRDIFARAGWPRDTAIIVDVPGPSSVAFAAALSDRFAPVFTFDNWPHLYGVVPSHQTLAATLYYLPRFERTQRTRAKGTPPIFVLDSYRLLPYMDEEQQFDNRYVAKIPDPEAFRALGIKHILYVSPDGARNYEMDDLNGAFLALDESGIDIKMVALTDFSEAQEPTPRMYAERRDHCLSDGTCYFYGGDPETQANFWFYFNWYWNGPYGYVWIPPPHRCSLGYRFKPFKRATMFHGIEGQELLASNGSPFLNPARSGSFGRFHGGFVS
jgi:hypothetical protein